MMGLRAFVLCLGVGVVVAGAAAQTDDVPAAAQHAYAEGKQYEQRRQLSSAADSYRSAVKAAGGKCRSCLEALAHVQLNMELFKDAAATEAQLVKDAPSPAVKAQAEYREGYALLEQYFAQSEGRGAIDKDPKKAGAALKQAEAVLQQGLADDPSSEALHMLHGRVLAALKHDEEAEREFVACAAMPGVPAEECVRAQHFAKDVSAARSESAPEFRAVTISGNPVSLGDLAGKVVVIDFWATWCGVCKEDSGYVQSMLDIFSPDEFVLLEVNVDESETTWSNYVAEHRLEGVHIWDHKGVLTDPFHVGAYPTYVVLDGDGMVRLRVEGAQGDLKGTVRKLLADAKAKRPETAAPMTKVGQ